MNNPKLNCVILADRHHGLTDGVRSLLRSAFDAVVMVADEPSLLESAERIQPQMVVVDLSLVGGEEMHLLHRVHHSCPQAKLIVLSVHDEPPVREAVLGAGADAFLPKRNLANDLLATVDAVLSGRRWPELLADATPLAEDEP